MWLEEQANAFTVAKMLNADLLVEVRALVEQALAEGQTCPNKGQLADEIPSRAAAPSASEYCKLSDNERIR